MRQYKIKYEDQYIFIDDDFGLDHLSMHAYVLDAIKDAKDVEDAARLIEKKLRFEARVLDIENEITDGDVEVIVYHPDGREEVEIMKKSEVMTFKRNIYEQYGYKECMIDGEFGCIQLCYE